MPSDQVFSVLYCVVLGHVGRQLCLDNLMLPDLDRFGIIYLGLNPTSREAASWFSSCFRSVSESKCLTPSLQLHLSDL